MRSGLTIRVIDNDVSGNEFRSFARHLRRFLGLFWSDAA